MNASGSPPDVLQVVVELSELGREFALATILQATGSTPCKAGTKAVFEASGMIHGTIGGGLVENETSQLAPATLHSRRPRAVDFHLEGGAAGGGQPLCGGAVRVLLDPSAARQRAVYQAAVAAQRRRERGLLLTTFRDGPEPQVVVEFLRSPGRLSSAGGCDPATLETVLQSEEPTLVVTGESALDVRTQTLVEPWLPRPRLLLIGGGHVGQAVAVQAGLVGFEVVVLDDRPEFASAARFPEHVGVRCGGVPETLAADPPDAETFVVIATRDHRHDSEALAACLRLPAAYLGMIGSRRKVAMLRHEFLSSQLATAEQFDRIHAPVGLDIGARTVPEIATSIVAELIAVRRRGRAGLTQSLAARAGGAS